MIIQNAAKNVKQKMNMDQIYFLIAVVSANSGKLMGLEFMLLIICHVEHIVIEIYPYNVASCI